MPLVTKCCCCCNLKYGYYTYGIICLALRVSAIFAIYFLMPSITIASSRRDYNDLAMVLSTMGWLVGWFVASSVVLFIALKGIVQQRSMLIYPYIVILILELIVMLVSTIIGVATVSAWFLVDLFIVGGINIYAVICLISLYQQFKEDEQRRPVLLEDVTLKTV